MLAPHNLEIIADEDIITANPATSEKLLERTPGHLSQQIIKSEFWRLGISQSYLCLDSDCQFIRPFRLEEFLNREGIPYTIIDEGRDILIPAAARHKKNIILNFQQEAERVQCKILRQGKIYNFGPNCPVWDARVWRSFDENFLMPNAMSLEKLILEVPIEMRWYGEALLKYKAIPLLPAQPFFKMYHYAWQLRKDQKEGIDERILAQFYCGVVYQSAWEREMDWPTEGGNMASRIGRRIRRYLGRI
jgi:hypothetical protein